MDIKLRFTEARKLKQRIIVVEKLIEIYETIEFERLEIYNGIPADFIKDQLEPYIKYEPIESVNFSIPSTILSFLTFQSDARAIERYIKKTLEGRYKGFLASQTEATNKSIHF